MAFSLRFLFSIAFLTLFIGCKTRKVEKKPAEDRLPEYNAMGGALYVFEPAEPPQPIKKVNLHDLSYAYAYNMFHIEKDTLWKRQQATYLARHAVQVVKEAFPKIAVLPAAKLEEKNYVQIMHTRAYPKSPYRETPPDLNKRIRDLIIPTKNWFQLFIETSTYLNKKEGLRTYITMRVFNTRSFELVYYDALGFRLDFRDTQTWRKALKFMLERLKENSEPPVGTHSGQNRGQIP